MKIYKHKKIYGMSFERNHILKVAESFSDNIVEHIIKCVIYGKSHIDYKKWTDEELCGWLYHINNMKPKKSSLRPKNYKTTLFSGMGDSIPDANLVLQQFHRKFVENNDRPFPDFIITYELVERVFNAFWEIANTMSNKLGKYSDNPVVGKVELQSDLHEILDKYCEGMILN